VTAPHCTRIVACHLVYDMIDKLASRTGWRTKLPGAAETLARLRRLADEWFLNDTRVYRVMQDFHADLERSLTSIYEGLDAHPVAESRKQLDHFLDAARPRFEEIQDQIVELHLIKAHL